MKVSKLIKTAVYYSGMTEQNIFKSFLDNPDLDIIQKHSRKCYITFLRGIIKSYSLNDCLTLRCDFKKNVVDVAPRFVDMNNVIKSSDSLFALCCLKSRYKEWLEGLKK